MRRRPKQRQGKGAIELIEEALHLLRKIPVAGLTGYYAGSFPFVLGFLYFWADMSRGSFAEENAGKAALAMSVLFVWMKCWQAYFSSSVRTFLGSGAMPRVSLLGSIRALVVQAAIQSTGLFLLPLGLIAAAPFGWLYAFYQNVSYYGDGAIPEVRTVARKAWQQAGLYPSQNHVLIFLISTFGIFVFLNLLSLGYLLPAMLKTFFGVETMFSMAGWHLLNTTFLAVVAGLTYLIVDPLVKTVYALRCFYGDALATGEDLSTELAGLGALEKAAALIVALGISACLMGINGVSAAEEPAASVRQQVAPEEMDRSLETVIRKREYAWRLPRLAVPKEEKDNPLLSFMKSIQQTVGGWCTPVKRWLRKAIEWFFDNVLDKLRIQRGIREPSEGWQGPLLIMFGVILAAASGFLGIALYRMWRRRQRTEDAQGEELPLAPDLESDQVSAADLPTSGWLDLARSLLKNGDRRLALRALYLAGLAHLGEQGLLSLARFKSDRDYEAELGRRARQSPDVKDAFSGNVRIFEGAWYGMHDVTEEMFSAFQHNQKRIMSHAEK